VDEKYYRLAAGKIFVEIKAAPGASKTEFAGTSGGKLRVRIAAPPEDGKANEELRRFIAKNLGCAKSDVTIEKGEKSRLKTLAFPAVFLPQLKTETVK
jgi:uncharacterized protein (TIGR00251 family)